MNETICERRPIADEIVDMLDMLVGYAEKVAGKASKLEPICNKNTPKDEGDKEVQEEWPELFDMIRSRANQVNLALDVIRNYLDRAEV